MDNWRDLDLEDLAFWPTIPRLTVVVIASLLTLVLMYFLMISPKLEQRESLISAEQTLKSEFEGKVVKTATLISVANQVEILDLQYQTMRKQLPVENELAGLLAGINELGVRNGLAFRRIEWLPAIKQDWLYEVPLKMEISGEYAHLGTFAADLARMPRIVSLHDFSIRNGKDKEGLSFNVSAKTYRFIEREDAK